MEPPLRMGEYLTLLARETAKTAWPGRMMGGPDPLLSQKANKATEGFFADTDRGGFRIDELQRRCRGGKYAGNYEKWHRRVCTRLARRLRKFKCREDGNTEAIAAKLVDTFMHQLMKVQDFRVLWRKLHVPLDRRALHALAKLKTDFRGNAEIRKVLHKRRKVGRRTLSIIQRPYSMRRKEYEKIQQLLSGLLEWLRKNSGKGLKWTSRIELNCWLWVQK